MLESTDGTRRNAQLLLLGIAAAGGAGIAGGLYFGITGSNEVASGALAVFEEPSSVPSLSAQPSMLPSDIPSAVPSDLPTVTPSSTPSLSPSNRPSALPSSSPSGSSRPSSLPSLDPTEFPTTSYPTFSPSASPSDPKVPVNREPDKPPRGYFNYDPNSPYGPHRWNRVSTAGHWLKEFGPNGFGPWKGHFNVDLTQNVCGGPKRKQSPKDLVENLRCDAGHEIRTKCASKPLIDDDAFEKLILPHKLSIVARRRPCLDVDEAGEGQGSCKGRRPPIADYPRYASSISDYSDLHNYDIKIPSEHTIAGERFDGEIQMFHTHLGNTRLSSIGVLIRATEKGFNTEFQKILDQFQGVYNRDKAQCNRRRLRGGGDEGLNATQWQRETQNTFKFNPYADELMPTMYFFRYDGSMTEPPCKDLTWWVMDKPMEIRFDQLEQLKRIMLTHVDSDCQKTSVHNEDESVARPIQPLGTDREIQHCRTGDFRSDEDKGRGPGKICR